MKRELNNFINIVKSGFFDLLPILTAFFAPSFYIVVIVLVLIFVDTKLGISASKKKNVKFSTNRFSDFFAKIIGYFIFISIGLLVQNETGFKYAVWISAIIPIYTEIKSIDENQRTLGKKGIITQAEEIYKFALRIKKKRDQFR